MHAIGHLLGKLLEAWLGKATCAVLSGSLLAFFGAVFLLFTVAPAIKAAWHPARGRPIAPHPDPSTTKGLLGGSLLSLFFICGGVGLVWLFASQTEEERAIDAIREAAGTVEQDETRPGKPVVKVSLGHVRFGMVSGIPLSDSDVQKMLPHLRALPELRELDLGFNAVTPTERDALRQALPGVRVSGSPSVFPPPFPPKDASADLTKEQPSK